MSFFQKSKSKAFLFLTFLCTLSLRAQFEKVSIRNTSIELETDLLADTAHNYIKIMLCGDIMHRRELLNQYANSNGDYNYRSWFRQVKPLFFYPDFVVGSLRSFFPGREQMNKFQNSAPDEFLGEISYTGFNVLMIGNRSALTDKHEINAKTQRKLHTMDIPYAGYYTDSINKSENYPLVLEKKDIRIAFLNYTTDSLLLNLPSDQINFLEMDSIRKDIKKARNTMLADYVIAYIDWGSQDSAKLGKVAELMNMGIDIVIGSGGGQAFTNADLLSYSDGSLKLHVDNIGCFNALSNEREKDKTAVIEVVLKKNRGTQQTRLHDMGFIPIWTLIDKERYAVLPISNIEEKHIQNINLNFVQYSTMKVALTDLRYAFFDKIPELHYDFNDKLVQNVEQTAFIRKTLMREQDKINDGIKKKSNDEYLAMFGSAPPSPGSGIIPYEDLWGMYRKTKQRFGASFDTVETYGQIDEMLENGTIHIKANHAKYQREKLRPLTLAEKRERDSIRRYNERFGVIDSIGDLKRLLKQQKRDSLRRKDSLFKASLDPNYRSTYAPPVEYAPATSSYKPEYRPSAFSNPNMSDVEKLPVRNIEEYFMVQFYTSASKKGIDIEQFPYLLGYEIRQEEGFYKYYVGRTNTPTLAIELCKSIRAKGFKDAFVVKYTNGVRTIFKDKF